MTETRNYQVQGMTCAHCVASVTEEVQEIDGVKAVDVVLETGSLTVISEGDLDDGAVREAVEEAGYQLT